MNTSQRYYSLLFLAIGAYFGISKYIFDKIYETSDEIIDEHFHVPQGIAFCQRNFSYWDPKITTLPGLYLITSALSFYFECNTYNLRLVNLLASCVNLFLFGAILKYVYFIELRQSKIVLQALNLSLLPPLYFFSHIYYTDTISLTFLLVFVRLCFNSKYKLLMLLFGFLSVLMRQTNIAWIALVLGHKTLDILLKSSRVFGNKYISILTLTEKSSIANDVDNSKLKRYYNLNDVFIALKYHTLTCFKTVFTFLSLQDWLVLLTHTVLLISFIIFVVINGSIVLGDKTAHEATIHLPQLLYFLIFYGFFGLPHVLIKLPSTIRLITTNKLKVLLLAVIMGLIVHFNTIEHPYLLADNRHFTFYIWNRWFRKYEFAVYATIPIYLLLLVSLYDNLKDVNCISFLLPYTVCLFLVLGLQKMIEVRYFLIPYIILRLRFVRSPYMLVVIEFLWFILINVAMFNVFFNKEVYWTDFDSVQRIIW